MRGSLQSYRKVSLESEIIVASPHRIIQLMFAGALQRLAQARYAMEQNDLANKGVYIGKAVSIIIGLQNSLNMDAGGQIAKNLSDLYDFMLRKITEANLFKNLTSNPTSLLVKTQKEVSSLVSASLISQFKDSVDVRTWGGPNAILEIVPKGVQKAMALSIVAHSLDVQSKNIIAFGDEHNDLELLDYAGWGVAMQNATNQLKAVANDVTPKTNDEDGLADYLEEFLAL